MFLCYQKVKVVRKLNTVCDKSHNLDWHRNFLVLKPAVSALCSDWVGSPAAALYRGNLQGNCVLSFQKRVLKINV